MSGPDPANVIPSTRIAAFIGMADNVIHSRGMFHWTAKDSQ